MCVCVCVRVCVCACACAHVCFVVEGVGMDAVVPEEEALSVVRPEDNPRTGPLRC